MTRAARAWEVFNDAEKVRAFTIMHGAFGEPGAELICALTADAALDAALNGQTYQAFLIA